MRRLQDYSMPDPRRQKSPRWATAGWLAQTIGLAAAVFFLLPMVAQAVPGDEAIVLKPGGDRVTQCNFTGQTAYPGDTVFCNLRVGNGSVLDGNFWVFSKENSLTVLDQNDNVITDAALRTRFISTWFFHVFTRPVITQSFPEEQDVTYDSQWVEVCTLRTLPSYDGGPANADYERMCPLGVIRGISGPRAYTAMGEPAYERQYRFAMTERDDGLDQSVFKGWGLKFDLVLRLQVPHDDTCPTVRANGICTTPVYQRP